MIRFSDILFSFMGIVIFSPILIIISIAIKLDSQGPVFFKQKRVGKDSKDFNLIKFRSMRVDSDKKGLLTVGNKDSRITSVGYFLRLYKLDELPQLFNVIKGDMSLVGPRPEVRKYVDLYTNNQKKVLKVRPGITDYASIEYIDENDVLSKSVNPEKTYVEEIMPRKIELNMKYINNYNLGNYFIIIFKTFSSILSK